MCQLYDQLLIDFPEVLYVSSSGNTGNKYNSPFNTVGAPGEWLLYIIYYNIYIILYIHKHFTHFYFHLFDCTLLIQLLLMEPFDL